MLDYTDYTDSQNANAQVTQTSSDPYAQYIGENPYGGENPYLADSSNTVGTIISDDGSSANGTSTGTNGTQNGAPGTNGQTGAPGSSGGNATAGQIGQDVGLASTADTVAKAGANYFGDSGAVSTLGTIGKGLNDVGAGLSIYNAAEQGFKNPGADLGALRGADTLVGQAAQAGMFGDASGAVGSAAGQAGEVLGPLAAAYDVYEFAKNWQSGATGADALNGAETGASIGTMVVPGIGTVVGAVIGAAVGALSSAFGGGKADPETLGLDAYSAQFNKNPAIGNSLTPAQNFQMLAGMFDGKSTDPGHSTPLEQIWGRMAEGQFLNDTLTQVNAAYKSGKINANTTPQQIYQTVVQPWLASKKGAYYGDGQTTGADIRSNWTLPSGNQFGNAIGASVTNLITAWMVGGLNSSTPIGIGGQQDTTIPKFEGQLSVPMQQQVALAKQQAAQQAAAQAQENRLTSRLTSRKGTEQYAKGGEVTQENPMVDMYKKFLKLKGVKGYADGGDVDDDNGQTPSDTDTSSLEGAQADVNAQRSAAAQQILKNIQNYGPSTLYNMRNIVGEGGAQAATNELLTAPNIPVTAAQENVNATGNTQNQALTNQGVAYGNQQKLQQARQELIKTQEAQLGLTQQKAAYDPDSDYSKTHVASIQKQLLAIGHPGAAAIAQNLTGLSAIQADAVVAAVMGQGKDAATIRKTAADAALVGAQATSAAANAAFDVQSARLAGLPGYAPQGGSQPAAGAGGGGNAPAQGPSDDETPLIPDAQAAKIPGVKQAQDSNQASYDAVVTNGTTQRANRMSATENAFATLPQVTGGYGPFATYAYQYGLGSKDKGARDQYNQQEKLYSNNARSKGNSLGSQEIASAEFPSLAKSGTLDDKQQQLAKLYGIDLKDEYLAHSLQNQRSRNVRSKEDPTATRERLKSYVVLDKSGKVVDKNAFDPSKPQDKADMEQFIKQYSNNPNYKLLDAN